MDPVQQATPSFPMRFPSGECTVTVQMTREEAAEWVTLPERYKKLQAAHEEEYKCLLRMEELLTELHDNYHRLSGAALETVKNVVSETISVVQNRLNLARSNAQERIHARSLDATKHF